MQLGTTRRSSASLKPKREAGEAPAKGKSPSAKKGERLPDPPEVRSWRIVWWVLLGIGLLAFLYVYATRFVVPAWTPPDDLARLAVGVEISALGAAIYIDFVIIRNLRKRVAEAPDEKGPTPAEEKDGAT